MKTVRTPDTAIFRRIVVLVALLSSTVVASGIYQAVIEDKLAITPRVTSTVIDTLFFGHPTILVTTARGVAGTAFAYRLETQPLRIVDTLIRDSVRDLRRALVAQLDADPGPDYLIATDSAVRVLLSGSGGAELVLAVPGRVQSLAASAVGGSIWVGYARDTSWTVPFWMTYTGHAGGLAYFPSVYSPGEEALPGLAAQDLLWRDCNGDGQPELLGLCHYLSTGTEIGGGVPHLSDWQSWGYSLRAITEDSATFFSSGLASLTLQGADWYGGLYLVGSIMLRPGIDIREWVTIASSVASGGKPYSNLFRNPSLTARSLHTGTQLWRLTGDYGRPFAWDLDANESPEVLAARFMYTSLAPTLVLNPETGDSIGVVESDYTLSPWASAILSDGERHGFQLVNDTVIVFSISTATDAQESDGTLPTVLELRGNYPNPFNSGTIIEFGAQHPGEARVTIFDALGRVVAQLSSVAVGGGRHRVMWDARNDRGFAAPSGVYFYRVVQGTNSVDGRMMLLR